MKFYTSDWRADPGLRMCSYAARGLWADLLSLMHESEPYGHLVIGGLAPDAQDIAGLLGGSEKEIRGLLAALEAKAVFSRTETGVIFSRRMVRDQERDKANRENGRHGGNPKLRPKSSVEDNQGVNPKDNLEVDEGDKAQIPEARDQKKEREPLATLAPSKPVEAGSDFEEFWKRYPRKVGKDDARKAFRQAIKRGGSVGEIIRAVDATVWNPDKGFIPHPATWLNGGRWQDDLADAAPEPVKPPTTFKNGFYALKAHAQREAERNRTPDLMEISNGND